MELIIVVISVASQAHVLEIVQITAVAMGNVKKGNASVTLGLMVQTAVGVSKELNVIRVSEKYFK